MLLANRLLWREHCQRAAANRRLSVDRDKHGALAVWAAGAPHPGVEQGEEESQAQQADDRHQVRRRHHRQRLVVYHAEQAEQKYHISWTQMEECNSKSNKNELDKKKKARKDQRFEQKHGTDRFWNFDYYRWRDGFAPTLYRVHSHDPSIPSHREKEVVWPDFQLMRVPEEPVCIHFFRQNPVFTSLHWKSLVHVVAPQDDFVWCNVYKKESGSTNTRTYTLDSPLH